MVLSFLNHRHILGYQWLSKVINGLNHWFSMVLSFLNHLHLLGDQWLSMVINGLNHWFSMVLSFINHLHLLGYQWPVCKGGNTDWPGLQIILMRELFTKDRYCRDNGHETRIVCWRENGHETRIIYKNSPLGRN